MTELVEVTQADKAAAQYIPHSTSDETALDYEKRCLRVLPGILAAHRIEGFKEGVEAAARWHDAQAAAILAKINPRLNVMARPIAQVHEKSATAIRNLTEGSAG